MTTDWLFRRQSAEDKAQQDAFLADIAAHWRPQTLTQRALHVQSLLVHLVLRLFSGGPTLAPAALAAIATGIGTAILMFSADPAHGQLNPGPPAWDYLLLTAGFLGFAVQAIQSPRVVRPWRMSLFFALPTAVGGAVNAATVSMVVLADQLFRVGVIVLSLGASIMAILPLIPAARRPRVLRIGMFVGGVGAIGTIIGDAQWAWLEAMANNASLSWGCAADALGAALLAAAFLHARPSIA
ncbi:MAG: hypothetical protein QOF57_987 [Frankiaceae bacterium]|nr:hypothetical protein [Frankiaceae bacterium]